MMRVRSLPEFAMSFQTDRHKEKKVMIFTVDGGPDENPRYEKTINCSIKYFVENGLDMFFLAANAPGRSTSNLVGQRMVKHSKELNGIILEHDKFGSHLDAKGVAVDKYLELKNFEYAGRTLAEIWSGLVIDGNPVVTDFIEDDAPVIVGTKSEEWKAFHVRQSKCTDPKCCSSFQSSYLKVIPKRFLPPPSSVVHTRNGIEWAKDDKDATYLSLYQNISLQNVLMPAQATKKFPERIPYDHFCLSKDQDMIKRRMCSHCGLYFSSLKVNHFTGLVAESLKAVLKTQKSVCDHCELLPVGKGSCYV